MRLRWKKDPRETGLRAIGAGPRSSRLHDGQNEYAWVSALGGGWRGGVKGWYFVIPSGAFDGAYENTSNDLVEDEATAKKLALDKVKQLLAAQAELK